MPEEAGRRTPTPTPISMNLWFLAAIVAILTVVMWTVSEPSGGPFNWRLAFVWCLYAPSGAVRVADEFYACAPMRASVARLAPSLQAWELTYNTVRPHQALHYLTPSALSSRLHPTQPTVTKVLNPYTREVSRLPI